jgi:hypothetical protein
VMLDDVAVEPELAKVPLNVTVMAEYAFSSGTTFTDVVDDVVLVVVLQEYDPTLEDAVVVELCEDVVDDVVLEVVLVLLVVGRVVVEVVLVVG